jgi:uncharacterized membrane protein
MRILSNLNPGARLLISLVIAALTYVGLPKSIDFSTRLLVTWDGMVLSYLVLVAILMIGASPEKTRLMAQRHEPNPTKILILVVFTAVASIVAIGFILSDSKHTPQPLQGIQISLAILAVICSWVWTHTTFALHYARAYYNDDAPQLNHRGYAGGLEFPTDDPPDYLDFMYFAFTISMTSQTSDISIISRSMRRLVLVHELVAFFFYSVIIGFVINVIAGLW